jgi:hypothetical protein
MMLFNDLIQHMDLVEIGFQGKNFSWSNMLDWVINSSSWALSFLDTYV